MRRRSRTAFAGVLLASVVATAACSRATTTQQAYTDITVGELQEMMASKDFVLVNVHTPWAGDIEGTDLSIPYNEIGHRTGEIPGGPDAKIVLYCRSGHMSAAAAEAMASLGYHHVYNLVGGRQAWEAAER